MAWSVFSVDTITGGDKEQIPVSDFQWSTLLSAGGSATVTIQLDEVLGYSLSDRQALFAEWARTIVLDWDGTVRFAGIVTGGGYDKSARTLTLTLRDLWGLWARRGAWDHHAPNMELWSITYTSMTLGTLAKRAVQRGTDGPPIPTMDLPITLPTDVSGSISRSYYGYQIDLVGDVLDDLLAEGLDIDFRGRWVSGAFDWQMLNDPSTGSHEWNVDADDGGVAGFREKRDADRVTNNSRVIGEGSGRDMLVRSNRNLSSTLPLLDRIETRKNISDETQAAAIADKNLDLYASPTIAWEFEIAADGDPGAGDLFLGDTAKLVLSGDPWLGSGVFTRRIVKLSGSLGEQLTVTCHETGGA
jgi:hypothetical protein